MLVSGFGDPCKSRGIAALEVHILKSSYEGNIGTEIEKLWHNWQPVYKTDSGFIHAMFGSMGISLRFDHESTQCICFDGMFFSETGQNIHLHKRYITYQNWMANSRGVSTLDVVFAKLKPFLKCLHGNLQSMQSWQSLLTNSTTQSSSFLIDF